MKETLSLILCLISLTILNNPVECKIFKRQTGLNIIIIFYVKFISIYSNRLYLGCDPALDYTRLPTDWYFNFFSSIKKKL